MKKCQNCQRQIDANAEVCECGAWFRPIPNPGLRDLSSAVSTSMSMWIHVPLMLVGAPLAWGLVQGFIGGFSLPTSVAYAVTKFFEWLGSSFIALFIGWLTLLFRKPEASWTALLVLVGLTAYSVHYTEGKIAGKEISAQRPSNLPATEAYARRTLRPQTASSGNSDQVEAVLPQLARDLNSGLPMMIDRVTRLDSTSAGPGRKFTYHYTLIEFDSTALSAQKLRAALSEPLKNSFCTSEDMKGFREGGVVVLYSYRGNDGNAIGDIPVYPRDCM